MCNNMKTNINKSWVPIIWFFAWGIFQAYVVISVIIGTWKIPSAFPKEPYEALLYSDIFFIPIYFMTSLLLFKKHYFGNILGLLSGGAMIYALIYLLALSNFKGTIIIVFDSLFLIMNLISVFIIIMNIRKVNVI